MKRAIVLSGGGAKGGYEIGCWKAFRHLGITFDIVTGTSVGALNGVMMVQNNYHKAYELWYFMDYKKVMDADIIGKFSTLKGKEEIIKKYAKAAASGGYEMNGLKKVIDSSYDKKRFFESNIDYGLVTTYFPSLRGKYVKKSTVKEDDFKNYLLASASCFPAFKPTKIGRNTFIDGGYCDNLPINLAIDLGAEEVIAIDLGAIGITKQTKNKNIPVTYIRPKNDLGNFLAFEKQYARMAIDFGYNDTMKLFNELEGDTYTFKKGSLKRNYDRNFYRFYDNLLKYVKRPNSKRIYAKLVKDQSFIEFNKILEMTASAYNIDPSLIYRTSLINIKIKKEFIKLRINNNLVIKRRLKKIKLNKNTINMELINYIYNEISKEKIKIVNNLAMLFPKSFLCALYIKSIFR